MRMKKAISLLAISLLIVMAASIAYAERGSNGSNGYSHQAEDSGQANSQMRNRLRQDASRVCANEQSINRLQEKLQTQLMSLRQSMQRLKENPNLDEEIVAQIRERLRLMRENRRLLGESNGKLGEEARHLRTNRREQNYEGCGKNLDNILKMQTERINLLQTMLADAEALLANLK